MSKKLVIAALLVIVIIWFASAHTWAADTMATASNVRVISADIVHGTWTGTGKMIFWKEYSPYLGNYMGYQAVIVVDSLRYTIYVSNRTGLPDSGTSDWISFWVRPEGTEDPDLVVTWTDDEFDGTVDFGIGKTTPPYDRHDSVGGDVERRLYQRYHNTAVQLLTRR